MLSERCLQFLVEYKDLSNFEYKELDRSYHKSNSNELNYPVLPETDAQNRIAPFGML